MSSEAISNIAKAGKPRKEWIDALRFVAITLVILGHLLTGQTPFFVFTSPIKLPLFFVISGYVFNYKRVDVKAFFTNLFFKLVIPWLCLTIPFILIKGIFSGLSTIPVGIYEIISGEHSWYMPCLIVAEVIWFFTNKYAKKTVRIVIVSIIMCVIGIALGKLDILSFAMINRAMAVQFYIMLGFLFKIFEDKFDLLKWSYISGLFVIYIIMGIISLKVWPDSAIVVHQNEYYNYAFSFSMIILGCFTIFVAARKFFGEGNVKVPGPILFVGQNTLVYYLFHNFNIHAIDRVLAKLHMNLPLAATVSVEMIFTYIACGIETLLILKFIPEALGKKRKKRSDN